MWNLCWYPFLNWSIVWYIFLMLLCFGSIDSITFLTYNFFLFLFNLCASFLLWWYSSSSISLLPFINHFSLAFLIFPIAILHFSPYHLLFNVFALSSFSMKCCFVYFIIVLMRAPFHWYSCVARSGSHNTRLNTSVPNDYAGTRFTNLINQNSTLKFTQKEVSYLLYGFNFGFIIHSNDCVFNTETSAC